VRNLLGHQYDDEAIKLEREFFDKILLRVNGNNWQNGSQVPVNTERNEKLRFEAPYFEDMKYI
jgi:hypothetical protein